MKKDLGIVQAVYPMPVLMVAAYDENEKVNVMNVAWGQICDGDKIILFIGEGKKTWLNIKASRAFTVALADEAHMDVADFFGIASGNKINDKFERTGYTAVKSDKVHAPVIEEFPVVMECELLDILDTEYVSGIVGRNCQCESGRKPCSPTMERLTLQSSMPLSSTSSSTVIKVPGKEGGEGKERGGRTNEEGGEKRGGFAEKAKIAAGPLIFFLGKCKI